MAWLRRIAAVGRIAEPAPKRPAPAIARPTGVRGSLRLRHVAAGSCNACEIEIAAAFGPVYDAERYGVSLVASPRHADGLLVTGIVTRNMLQPLRNTLLAIPEPRIVIAVGDCAISGGPFTGSYAVVGPIRDVIGVDLEVPGCPPHPDAIVAALRSVTGR